MMAEEMEKTSDCGEGQESCKRKLDNEASMFLDDSSSSNVDDDFIPYEFSIPPNLNEIDSSELGSDSYTEEELQVVVHEVEDWKDPMATQLEGLLMANLEAIFTNAIKMVADAGYSREMAEMAISRKAIYTEGDALTNIAYHTLNHLKGKGSETTADFVFQNLQQLMHYTMVEMIGVLQDLKPSLTVTEAMWELLINDLSITRAIAGEDKPSGVVSSGESSAKSPVSPSKSEVQSSGIISDISSLTSQKGSQECKSGPTKVTSRKELALALRQKFIQMEKSKACGKGGVKLAKLTSVSGLIVEKRLKPQSEISNQKMKRGSSNTKGVSIGGKGVSIGGAGHVSTSNATALPEGGSAAKLPTKDAIPTSPTVKTTRPKAKCSLTLQKIFNYCADIPFDEALDTYVPRDEKDAQVLVFVSRAKELQDEVQSWDDWTNKKVMQVAEKLRKLQTESKSLKKEAEVFRKDRKTLEENAEKRISEMENAMDNNKNQLDSANTSILILEEKKSLLEKELEAAKLWAEKSMASQLEALEREQMAIKKVQSCETMKGLLQDDLVKEKQTLSNLQEEIKKGENHLAHVEGRVKAESAKKEQFLAEAAFIRKEREKYEALMQAEEDAIRKKAAIELQEHVERMVKKDKEMVMLKQKSGSKTSIPSMKEIKNPETSTTVGSSQNKLSSGKLKREHECVMCLSEERSVVFLPCAHQVLCPKCNELHEKQGMKICPSCRASIEHRIHTKFLGK